MITSIINNPFRILGVFTNATLKAITANKGKMIAFAKVGKSMSLPTDMNCILPVPNRSIENIDSALSVINLPIDKIKHALFWFINTSPMDEVAINHLQNENYEKATEIFLKKKCYSSLINRGILALLQEDTATAIENITELIHDDEYRTSFVEAVCGSTFIINEGDLAKLFIDELLVNISASTLLQMFTDSGKSSDDDNYIRNIVIGEPISLINKEIEIAKHCGDTANEEYNAGVRLIKNTKVALKQLRDNLSRTDLQYQTTVDALARQILQCGINYFNTSDDDDDVDKALVLQGYAQKIAVSKLLKDRCAENVGILKQRKELGEVGPAIENVKKELESFGSRTASISTVKGFVQRCTPNLVIIGSKLGFDNELSVKISAAVVHNALGMLVDVINREQENKLSIFNGTLKSSIDSAINIINDLKTLKMDSQCLSRLSQNEQTLKGLQSQLNKLSNTSPAQTYRRPTQTPNYRPQQTTQTKSFYEENTGCVWIVIIGLIIAIISSLS